MEDLVADARSGDQFYFHCLSLTHDLCHIVFIFFYILVSDCGDHRLADVNGDEEDGWDECMSNFIFFSYNLIISYRYPDLRL